MNETKQACVAITGATGLIGRRLVPRLLESFEHARLLSRSAGSAKGATSRVEWDGMDPGEGTLEGVDAVVHLAGEPIFGGLPTSSRLARVRASRVESTRAFVRRIGSLAPDARPRTFVCASAVGFYGEGGEQELSEDAPAGTGFLAEVCRDWEAAAIEAEALGVRVVRLRLGVVLAREGGALALMRIPFRLGIGGRLGSGRQFFPWVHIEDVVSAIEWAVTSDASGAVNVVGPEAARNSDLTAALGEILHRPTILPVPGFAIRAALGEVSGELLGSRRVVPAVLRTAGFRFQCAGIEAALAEEL